jgi:hypothetical protein
MESNRTLDKIMIKEPQIIQWAISAFKNATLKKHKSDVPSCQTFLTYYQNKEMWCVVIR